MRPRSLFAVLALLLLLAAGVWTTALLLGKNDEGESAEAAGARPEESTQAARPAESLDSEDAPAELVGPEDDAEAALATDPSGGRRVAEPTPEGAVVIAGRVALPGEAPADELLRVVALPGARDVRTLGGGGAFAMIWGGDAPLRDGEQAQLAPLSDTEVAPDGTFRLILPEGVERAHLAVSGRYHFSESTTFQRGAATDVVLTPRLGTWISGTVSPAAGAPALTDEELQVVLFPDLSGGRFDPMAMGRGFTSSRALVGADGHFEFRGVPTTNVYGVVARTEQHAMPYATGVVVEAGGHERIELTAEAGGSVLGRVVDADGNGVAAVDVAAHRPGILGQVVGELRETETDEQGRFELAGLPAGELELGFGGGLHLPGTKLLDPPLGRAERREDVELTVDAGASLVGTVRFPGGAPAAGASVSLSRDLSSTTMAPGMNMGTTQGASGTVDEDGAFELQGLAGGPFLARASLEVPEGEHIGSWSVRQPKVKLSDGTLDLFLEKEEVLRVRVTDVGGAPLSAFELRATLAGSSGMFGLGATSVQQIVEEAEDGVGTLGGLTPGSWELDVDAEGFAPARALPFDVPRGDAPMEVALLPTATIRGQVLDAGGAAAGGARVTLSLGMEQMFSGRGQPAVAVADAEGAFELRGLEPGTNAILAEGDGAATSEAATFELEPGQVVEDVVLTLRTGGTILGQVLDGNGDPWPSRMIVAQRPPDFGRQRLDRSDDEGRFVLEHLEPGRWQVTAMRDMLSGDRPGGDDAEEAMASMMEGMEFDFVEVPDGETVELVLGAASEGAVSVKVRVLSDGEPVARAMVSFVAEGADSEGGARSMEIKLTGADGVANVELERPGPYLVSVQQNMAMGRQSVVEFVETIPEAEEHTLELELPIASIAGRVYDPAGDPLAGARVTLTVEGGMSFGSFLGGNYAEVVTDEEGDYVVENLRPGTYSVAAGGATLGGMFGGDAPGGRVVRGGLRVTEGQRIDGVDFRLEAPGSIRGFVRDQSGAPVQEAAVFVRDTDGRLLERFSFVSTNEEGRFTYSGVQPGRYFVSARAPGRASHESAPVEVGAGKTAEVTLRLEVGTVLLVRVVDRSGEDAQARVRVVDPNGHEVSGMLSMQDIMESFGAGFSSKVQRIGPLAPGRYEVEVTTDDGRSADKPVVLDGRPERPLTIRLR